ncbi:MAG: hypothetical protein ACKPA9_28985, partial [Microcystis sp.]
IGTFAHIKICTDSHYKKSIAQTADKVKSFPILMGANFPESKKGLWWGQVLGRFLLGSGKSFFRERLYGGTSVRPDKSEKNARRLPRGG